LRAESGSGEEVTTLDRVRSCIARRTSFPIAELTAETRFDEDLKLDSLDFLDVIVAIEDAFSVKIPEPEMVKMRTIGDLVRWLVAHGC
jgi:acyl carrier protein